MRRLRTFALAVLLASLNLGPSPASAQTAILVFSGTVNVNCFGCGAPSPCDANLAIFGITHSGPAATTSCTAISPPGLCLVTGTADGTVVGAGLTVTFTWTRVGATALITTGGDVVGAGTAVFVTPSLACGVPMRGASIVGWVVGV